MKALSLVQFASCIILSFLTKRITSSSVLEDINPISFDKTNAMPIADTILSSNVSHGKLAYDEEYKLFQLDHSKKRKKRFVYYNIDGVFDVGFLVVIPITVVVPGMSNLFNTWRRRRSADDGNNRFEDDYEDHPNIQPQLDRISAYFDLLNIPEHACQLRAVCEFSADQSKYFPISDLILKRLRNPAVPSSVLQSIYDNMDNTTLSQSEKSPSLFLTFNKAADDGMMYGSKRCSETFGVSCKYPMDKLLSMTSLRFWRVLRSKLHFHLKDEFVA